MSTVLESIAYNSFSISWLCIQSKYFKATAGIPTIIEIISKATAEGIKPAFSR